MVLSVAGKYAIITGAGSGINLAFARLLLNKGCSVLIGDLSLRPGAEDLLARYPHPGPGNKPTALFHRTNVASWPDLSALVAKAEAEFPSIDIVVPGAGIFEPRWSDFWRPPKTATNPDSPSADRADADPGTYATLDVNLTHPIRLSQLAIGYWTRAKKPGTLLHVSSVAGHAASIGTPLYYASKHGLNGFVRSLGGLRDELGIRVAAVSPGSVTTPLWTEDAEKNKMKGANDNFIEPEEIADAMLEVVEKEEFGDGTIYEVLKGKRRVVPLYGLTPPKGDGTMVSGYEEMQAGLYERLRDGTYKV